jgi:hypothetical protein
MSPAAPLRLPTGSPNPPSVGGPCKALLPPPSGRSLRSLGFCFPVAANGCSRAPSPSPWRAGAPSASARRASFLLLATQPPSTCSSPDLSPCRGVKGCLGWRGGSEDGPASDTSARGPTARWGASAAKQPFAARGKQNPRERSERPEGGGSSALHGPPTEGGFGEPLEIPH